MFLLSLESRELAGLTHVRQGQDSSVRSNVEKLYKVLLSQRVVFETEIVNAIAKR